MKVLKDNRNGSRLFVFVLISAVICYGSTSDEDSCLPMNFSSCTCSDNSLTCKGVSSMDILSAAVESAQGLFRLNLIDSDLLSLPPGLLHKSGITHFRIENTVLPFLSFPDSANSPFQGKNSLSDLTIDRVRYPYNWQWSHLHLVPNLSSLRIVNSDLVYINPSFKDINSSSLQVLVIENSGVRWISDGAFSSLPYLSFFHATSNRFSVFKRSYLPVPASTLSLLNLKNNKLAFVEEDLFSDMPELIYVNLESNNLATLSEKIVSDKMRKRLFVDLAGNPFHCDCSLNWLRTRAANFDIYRIRCTSSLYPLGVFFGRLNWNILGCQQTI